MRKYARTIQPWESTEDVFSDGAHELGLSSSLSFEPVFEQVLPARTIALILIYPTPPDYEEKKEAEEAKSAQQPRITQAIEDCDVVWLSQKVQNACGPYALLHSIYNSDGRYHLVSNSILDKLHQGLLKASSQEERNARVEEDMELWENCFAIGMRGATSFLEDAEGDVENHYVCFAGRHGKLAMFDSDSMSGPKDLDIKLDSQGLIPSCAFNAIEEHIGIYGGEGRDYHVLLALVNNAI